ncbi:MAG TPA: hypothetical protein VME43_22105 [Bryobacteraceae bacterium]|nr:hypothetical protein [Bryobacteraceae bacterium]
MWPAYLVITWFVLALAVPVAWGLGRAWRRARVARRVTCPVIGAPAEVTLDPWFAVKMHAIGNPELRVLGCGCWPQQHECGRECLEQVRRAA